MLCFGAIRDLGYCKEGDSGKRKIDNLGLMTTGARVLKIGGQHHAAGWVLLVAAAAGRQRLLIGDLRWQIVCRKISLDVARVIKVNIGSCLVREVFKFRMAVGKVIKLRLVACLALLVRKLCQIKRSSVVFLMAG